MISKNLTSQEIIFIHQIIEEKFQLPKGHIKVGELETLIVKSEGLPFSKEPFSLFQQAAIIFEGLVRIHIFIDGNKRTALEATRQFLNRNDHVFVIPLSGTNFIYKIAREKTRDSDKVVSKISSWLKNHSAKSNQLYKARGLIVLNLYIPLAFFNFFSKVKMVRISRWVVRRYLTNKDPDVTEFMFSIYEKQLGLFESIEKKHKKKP